MATLGSQESMAGQKQTETYHGNGIRLDIEFGAVLVATFTDVSSINQKEEKVGGEPADINH